MAPYKGKAGRYCVQRPPSNCYGRIAMPAAVEGVPEQARHAPISPYISMYLPISPAVEGVPEEARRTPCASG